MYLHIFDSRIIAAVTVGVCRSFNCRFTAIHKYIFVAKFVCSGAIIFIRFILKLEFFIITAFVAVFSCSVISYHKINSKHIVRF